jgi:D-alanyl-D-alanine carboxypeptidase/D-alanyl-D-alanine-endopeptidase (penicillin-binding protein 4)
VPIPRIVAVVIAVTLLIGCARPDATQHVARPAAPTPIAAAPSAPPWNASDVRALQTKLRTIFHDPTLASSGLAVVDAAARPLFEQRAGRPYAPASTFKVLAAISALETYGPNYRFTTEIRALDPPSDGTIASDVWLIGSGDPTLSSADLQAAAGVLARAGVQRIDGALVADASAFGGSEINKAWDPDDLQYDYAAGTSALAIDEGTVEFHLVPAAAGLPARIETRPPSDGVRVLGSVLSSYATTLTIDRAPDKNDFVFGGRIAAGAEQSFFRPVVDMPVYAGRVAQSFLRARGIVVRDGVRTGVAPLGGTVLWRHESPPLRDILRHMLFVSDNHYAEQLLRAVGAQRGIGTETTGGAVERAIFRRDGVPQNGLRIVDGSGLASSDRVAAISLATLLARAAAEPIGRALITDLPRVGIEGTVRYRAVTDALGRARAKSGHIANVNALAGYVQTHSHGRVAFAFIVNDPRADDGPVDDGITRALDVLADE